MGIEGDKYCERIFLTTRGEQAQPRSTRSGICFEPATDCVVSYEHIRKNPVDSRAAGYSPRDDDAINRVGEESFFGLSSTEVSVFGYIQRCEQKDEEPDIGVIAALSGDD